MNMAGPRAGWPFGAGEMAALVRARDWGATPLGPAEGWPAPLRAAVGLMLDSPLVSSLAVGPGRVLLYNDAAARLYGERHPAALGRPIPETWPEAYASVAPLYERAFAGEAVHVPVQPLEVSGGGGEVFEATLTPVRGEDGTTLAVQMIGVEVGARVRAEAALRDSEERGAFLLALSDALRPLGDPAEIEGEACRLLGERLGVAHAHYARIDEAVGRSHVARDYARGEGPSLVGDYDLGAFGWIVSLSRAGRAVAVADARTSPVLPDGDRAAMAAIGVAAIAVAPLVKDGAWVGALVVTEAGPRDWTASEMRLLEETGERIWASTERARAEAALRESEERLHVALGAIGLGAWVWHVAEDRTEADARALAHFGLPPDGSTTLAEALAATFHPEDGPRYAAAVRRAADPGGPGTLHEEFRIRRPDGQERWMSVSAATTFEGTPPAAARMTGVLADVTDRKRAEERLREGEERGAFLLRLADALRPLADPAEITGTATRLLGEALGASRAYYVEWPPGEDFGEVARDHAAPGLSSLAGRYPNDAFRSTYDRISQGGTWVVEDNAAEGLSDAERAHYQGLGVIAWVDVPLLKRGRVEAALCVVQGEARRWTPAEVTLVEDTAERTWAAVERARAEAARTESEERLREFGEASSDVLWVRDARTLRWVYLTPAFEAIYGLSREEALHGDDFRNWADLIVPEDRERAVHEIERVVAGERVTFEYRVRRPRDGALRWIRNTDFPIRGPNGEVERIGGVGHDVTEEKRAEEAVARSEAALQLTAGRLTTLLEGIPQLVWRAEGEGEWTWASPQWTAFTGQPEEQSHGWGWLDPIHPDDRAGAREAWRRARATNAFAAEYRLLEARTGRYRWFQSRALTVRDGEGRLVEWLGTSTDVQDLREMQDRLRVLVAELQHRTRNLMAVVLGVMRRTKQGSPGLDRFAADFQSRLDALARVQGLLSRLDEGDRVAFDELLRSELGAMGALDGRDWGAQVTLDGPEGVRLRSSTIQTFALALHELATNAAKYGALAQRGGRLAVRWRRARLADGPGLRVEWTESGVAMPPPDAAPRGGGYGRELIERALPYQLGAETTYEMGADGVRCTITLPLSSSTSP